MFKSYLKVAWRSLLRNKGYSFINIGGLVAGMSIAVLIGLWINDEVSYDKYHPNYSRIAQVMQHMELDGRRNTMIAVPRPLENVLRVKHPHDFANISMSTWTNENVLSIGEKKITQLGAFVQSGFPEMLSIEMISGTRAGLKDASAIILSASAAHALFGNLDPMGQLIRINSAIDAHVVGVYKDLPYNTSFRDLKFMASWEGWVASQPWSQRALEMWDNNSFQMFVQIHPSATMIEISEKIKTARSDYSDTWKPEIFLHPMSDWHLRSEWSDDVNVGGGIQTVWMFATIGTFVLLLACVNFMNLSTARSEKRSKEVGIRMTVGSVRGQLIRQFLVESLLVVVLAFIVAIAAVLFSLPAFNMISDKQIEIRWLNPYFWLATSLFILVTSFVAGSYPALYLSSFRPVKVLKGVYRASQLASLPRKILVVAQFTVSITIAIGTIIVHQQLNYSQDRPVGYDREGLVMILLKSEDSYGKVDVLRTALLETGAAEEVAQSSSPLTETWNFSGGFNWQGKDPDTQSADFGVIRISPEYGKTVNWKIKEGRDLSRESSDSTAVLLNEAAVKFMNVEDPVGMEIQYGDNKYHVVGVVRDMVTGSPYSPEQHKIYIKSVEVSSWINIRLNRHRGTHESLAAIEPVFKTHTPSEPFEYKFVDEEYARKFTNERRIAQLSNVFAVLAMIISCLGLIGLASFMAEQRTKEIGVRKVLGASVAHLWRKLSGDFFVLVIISCILSIPIGWYIMREWLRNYDYRIDITWTVFAIAVFGALSITLVTVSYQAIKAATADPVKALRSE